MTTAAPITAAFEDLRWLQRFAHGLARDADDAADLVQDTLVEAWRDPPANREAPLRPWLAGVLRNRFRMRKRSERRREAREEHGPVAAAQPSPDAEQARLEVLESLLGALRKLPAQDQRIVVRRFFNEESAAEIGRDLDLPPATVRSRIHRSLSRLRTSLDRRHGDRKAWCAAILAIPTGVAPTATTTGNAPMMSLTTKIFLTATAGTVGLAGWMTTRTPEQDAPEPSNAQVATPSEKAAPATPRAHWEQRRERIRAALPTLPKPAAEEPEEAPKKLERKNFSDLVEACMEDTETKQTGAVTIALHEIGSPDVGTIFESVKVVHTNFDDAELVECLTQSMYGYVGEAPDAPVERQLNRTLRLGTPTDDDGMLHQIAGRIVGAHISEVRFCQTKGEDVRGTVTVAMTMGNDGMLSNSEAQESELPEPVVDCIVAATMRWKFPRVEGGQTFEHNFDLPMPERSQ